MSHNQPRSHCRHTTSRLPPLQMELFLALEDFLRRDRVHFLRLHCHGTRKAAVEVSPMVKRHHFGLGIGIRARPPHFLNSMPLMKNRRQEGRRYQLSALVKKLRLLRGCCLNLGLGLGWEGSDLVW